MISFNNKNKNGIVENAKSCEVELLNEHIYVYTDASFNNSSQLGVAGYLIFLNTHDHVTQNMKNALLKTTPLKEKNNIRIELRSLIIALNEVSELYHHNMTALLKLKIFIFTDCKSISDLPSRRKKLEANNYKSKTSLKPLSNADLYQAIFEYHDQFPLKFVWLKGHSPQTKHTLYQENFRIIDKEVRKQLRNLVPYFH